MMSVSSQDEIGRLEESTTIEALILRVAHATFQSCLAG